MNQPNILFIMSDDHAVNAISAYESRLKSVFKTPNIDRIANEGCKFESCICTNAICTPSRSSILTGLHSHINGVRTLDDTLDVNAQTFPKIMQAEGYQTAIFGKWHVHSEPQGFDEYMILPNQGKYFDPCFLNKESYKSDKRVNGYPEGFRVQGYVSEIITDMCLDYLEEIKDNEKPFMLMCHHKAPHDFFEYHPRDEHIFDGIEIPEPESLFEDKLHRSDGSRVFGTTVSDNNVRRNYIQMMTQDDYPTGKLDVTGLNSKQRTKVAYQKYLKDYLRTVKGIDDNVGRILDYLDKNNLADNTIVIYTSDQGMLLGEHDYIDKRWIFDESAKMPFLIRYPKSIKPSSEVDNVVSNVDFAPTLLDYAGISVPDNIQGRSFKGVIEETDTSWNDEVYFRYWMHMTHHDVPAHYGLRTKDYLLVYFYGLPLDATGALQYPTPEGWELYDLKKDPLQMKNVYEKDEHTEVVEMLKNRLKEIKGNLGDEDNKYPAMMKLKQKLI